jgi:PST family polysaccharide transporter
MRAVVLAEVSASALGSGIAVVAAVQGAGARALVLNVVTSALLGAVFLSLASRWRPLERPTRADLFEQFMVSSHMLRNNLLNYANRNVDNLLIGRFLGPEATGLYVRSYSLLTLPIQQVSAIFGRVMVPALATLQPERQRARETYLKSLQSIVAIAAPSAMVLAVMADGLVPVVLGSDWTGAVPIIRVFALLSVLQIVATTFGWVLLSHGQARHLARLATFNTAFTVASFAVGVVIGTPLAVALSYAIGCLLSIYPSVQRACRTLDLHVGRLLRTLVRPLLLGLAVATCTLLVRRLDHGLAEPARLFSEGLVALTALIGLARLLGLRIDGFSRIADPDDHEHDA